MISGVAGEHRSASGQTANLTACVTHSREGSITLGTLTGARWRMSLEEG